MKIIIIIFLGIQLFSLPGLAQNNIDTILKQVENNSKSISANKKYWDAKRLGYKTNLSLYDPQVEYDYLWGSPAIGGNQQDFSVTQRLDFPTAYKRKKEFSKEQITQSAIQESVFRQDILLETKYVVLELIYLNKKYAELNRRFTHTEQLLINYEKKLDKGDVIILDVNKAKLQLLNIKNEVALNQNEKQIALTKLAELNGGITVQVNDTLFPALPLIPDFETLDSTIEANDPLIKVYEQEKLVLQQQISLQKAMNWPKIEAGYHSQGILGQTYKGFHAGITVPLWENKNKVKSTEASLDHAIVDADRHRLEHRMENKRLFEQLEVRKNAMQEYVVLLGSLNNTELLNKALRLGEITITQYFLDQAYYFSAYDQYMRMEKEYHIVVAELYKYKL